MHLANGIYRKLEVFLQGWRVSLQSFPQTWPVTKKLYDRKPST